MFSWLTGKSRRNRKYLVEYYSNEFKNEYQTLTRDKFLTEKDVMNIVESRLKSEGTHAKA